MDIKIKLSSLLLIAVAFVMAFVSIYSFASAQSEAKGVGDRQNQISPDSTINSVVPGGPGFVSVAGTTFTPAEPDVKWSTMYVEGYLYNPSTTVFGWYVAPISLPDGAIVTKVVAYYVDTSESYALQVFLYRKTLGSDVTSTMSYLISDGEDGLTHVYDDTVQFNEVDNQMYAYYMILTIPNGLDRSLLFDGIRVDYSFPNYLPYVTK